jgi:hypothetical protein
MNHLVRDLYPAIVSGAVVGAIVGLYSALSGVSEWFRGFGLFLVGWSLFVLSRGLLAIVVLPFVLLEIVIAATLPFILAYAGAHWLGMVIAKRASTTKSDVAAKEAGD